jgi:hypothetical protein
MALAGLIASHSIADEITMKYMTVDDKQGTFFHAGTQLKWQSGTLPAGWKAPKTESKNPLHATLKLGDSEIPMLLDCAQSDAKFYDRLVIDTNANGELADEQPLKPQQQALQDLWGNVGFPTIDVSYHIGDRKLQHRLQLMFYLHNLKDLKLDELNAGNFENYCHSRVQGKSYYRGELTAGGQIWQICLIDGDLNGRYGNVEFNKVNLNNSAEVNMPTGDKLYIAARDETLSYYDGQPFAGQIWLAGEVYDLKLQRPDLLELTANHDPSATLELPEGIRYLTLTYADTSGCLTLTRPTTAVKLPAREYRLMLYQMQRSESNGAVWQIISYGTSHSPSVALQAKGKQALKIGEPFTLSVNSRPEGKDLRLNMQVTGNAGECLTSFNMVSGKSAFEMSKKNSTLPAEPQYRIAGADGEVVSQGKFEYG